MVSQSTSSVSSSSLLIIVSFPQLDRLVGLAMLIVATTVFLYYTTWTLLMVILLHFLPPKFIPFTNNLLIALRRPRPPLTLLLSPTRLGHPHPRHPHPPRLRRRRQFLKRGHDQE